MFRLGIIMRLLFQRDHKLKVFRNNWLCTFFFCLNNGDVIFIFYYWLENIKLFDEWLWGVDLGKMTLVPWVNINPWEEGEHLGPLPSSHVELFSFCVRPPPLVRTANTLSQHPGLVCKPTTWQVPSNFPAWETENGSRGGKAGGGEIYWDGPANWRPSEQLSQDDCRGVTWPILPGNDVRGRETLPGWPLSM